MAAAAVVSSKQRLYNTLRLSSPPFLCRRSFSNNSSSSNNNREDGNEFESLFGNPSPSKTSSEPAFWKSLMKDSSSSSNKNSKVEAEKKQGISSSSSTTTDWDFLKEIRLSSSSSSTSRNFASSQDAARPSFRKLGESGSGFDFLSAEDLDRPYTKKDASKEEAKQEETDSDFGELSIMKSASFQLLRESFQKVSQPSNDMKTLDSALGLDSGTLFTSQEPWSKSVGSQTLAEFEGNFYSSSDAQVSEDVKTYTYEELGSKLQQVRPSKDQILFSATGLSFGELRTRLQKVEELENEALEEDDQSKNYRDLRESIGHLRDGVHSPKALTATKHLSYEELTFINTISSKSGPPIKIEYTPPKDHLLTKYYSEVQLSSKERLNLEIKKLREEFQTHEYDSGSPQVQIAILTARINNVNRHLREGPNYKRDKHSRKGLNDMVQYRKKLLRYLRRKDWPVYCNVLTKLNLDDVILSQRS